MCIFATCRTSVSHLPISRCWKPIFPHQLYRNGPLEDWKKKRQKIFFRMTEIKQGARGTVLLVFQQCDRLASGFWLIGVKVPRVAGTLHWQVFHLNYQQATFRIVECIDSSRWVIEQLSWERHVKKSFIPSSKTVFRWFFFYSLLYAISSYSIMA